MLKHKCIHSILQQNKFNTINIFDYDIVKCSAIEGNVVFYSYHKNKIRTNELEIH